jgi:hypothetical protein
MEAEENQTLDVYPVNKGRRALVFLADYFLSFILALFVFSFIVFPSAAALVDYSAITVKIGEENQDMLTSLYLNDLLFYEGERDYDLEKDLQFTYKKFIVYCLKTDDVSQNVFYNYFGLWRGQEKDLPSLYSSYDPKYVADQTQGVYFSSELDANGIPKLNQKYREEFAPVLDEKDTLGTAAQTDYDTVSQKFFLPFYKGMISEIETYDYQNQTALAVYEEKKLTVMSQQSYQRKVLSVSAGIAYFLTWLGYFLAVPLIDKKGRTCGLIFLKCARAGKRELKVPPRRIRALVALYAFFFNASYLLFLPAANVVFAYLFALPALWPISLVSLLLMLVSAVFLICSGYSQTLEDRLTYSLVILGTDLDQANSARGIYL